MYNTGITEGLHSLSHSPSKPPISFYDCLECQRGADRGMFSGLGLWGPSTYLQRNSMEA